MTKWFVAIAFATACIANAHAENGVASVYGGSDGYCNKKTASGVRMNCDALTAAHKKLALGTRVRVTNHRNGRSIVVTINDRGPFVRGRVIDVTPAGARALGFSGLTNVSLEVVR